MTCSATKEAQLKAQGWTRQFRMDEPRLSEAVQAVIDLPNHAVGVVEHVECQQPAHDHHCDDKPEDDENELVEQPNKRLHLGDPRASNFCFETCSERLYNAQARREMPAGSVTGP